MTVNKLSGFEPIPDQAERCMDPGHVPPAHLWIPPGLQYRHVCPSCGNEMVINNRQVTMFGMVIL